jgi:hypothetical protein
MTEAEAAQLTALAGKRGEKEAATVRALIREAAQREGVKP